MCVCEYVCVCVCVYVCVYVSVCEYQCVCVSVCVYMLLCVCGAYREQVKYTYAPCTALCLMSKVYKVCV